jgi:hypothetical protein
MFGKFTVAQSEFAKHFVRFWCCIKRWFFTKFTFLMLANVILWVCTQLDCAGAFFGQQGGIWVLAGLALSSQKLGYLLSTHWLVKPIRKIQQKMSLARQGI